RPLHDALPIYALRRKHVAPQVEREHVAEAPHTRLSREMEDAVDAVERQRVLREVEAPHVEPGRIRLLLGGVVVVGEAVDPQDLVTGGDECLREVRADEASRAGDDVSHRPRLGRGAMPYTC